MKQQVEYLREDGKPKNGPNGMLTITEADGDGKSSSSRNKKGERNMHLIHEMLKKTLSTLRFLFFFYDAFCFIQGDMMRKVATERFPKARCNMILLECSIGVLVGTFKTVSWIDKRQR